MDKTELVKSAYELLSETKTAILSTVSTEGQPRMRWMSPVFLKSASDRLYAVTSKRLSKTRDLENNSRVQWMLQDPALRKIITFEGEINLVEDLSLRTEVLEATGNQLNTFWTINNDPSSLIVIETVIRSAVMFIPVEGKKYLVKFGKEVSDD